MEPSLEAGIDRESQSGLARFVARHLRLNDTRPSYTNGRHSREGGNPTVSVQPLRIPAFAGMTGAEQSERRELDASGIHVAEYLTVLPPPDVLHRKLHEAIETARARIEAKDGDSGPEMTA